MKVKFFKIIVLLVPLLCNAVPHGSEYDCMLVSLPASGSSFFAAAIAKSNQNVRYNSEQLTRQWGGINYVKYLPEGQLKGLYNSRFARTDYNFTKEVFMSLHTGLWIQRFTVFCLYRKRQHTFPCKKHTQYFLDMFKEFVTLPCPDQIKESVRTYIKKNAHTDLEKQVAIHTLLNYIMCSDAQKYGLNVIEYAQIMQLEGPQLHEYLENKVPKQLMTHQLVSQILVDRFEDSDFLSKREQNYQGLAIELFCQDLLSFIKQLDPAMQYWYLFE